MGNIRYNPNHSLHYLLPKQTERSYSLRSRSHNFELFCMHDDRNFIDRMLLRHIMRSNLLYLNVSSLSCVLFISFCPFLHCEIDALCHHFNKAFMYVCMYAVAVDAVACPAGCETCDSDKICNPTGCAEGYFYAARHQCIGQFL